MAHYNKLIREIKDFYIGSKIALTTKPDYEVVCKSLLDKYPKLNEKIAHYCKIENAAPKKGTVKRLQPHVFYF